MTRVMIQEVSNIELFEMLETDSKTQCTACLLYWNVGIVYCTCGHFLQKETEANRSFDKFTIEIFHFQNKSSRSEVRVVSDMEKSQTNHNTLWLTNRRRNAERRKFQGIHDRFFSDHDLRARMFGNNRDEVCQRWDVLEDEDHTHHLTAQEYFYNKNKWWFHFNKSGSDNVPLRNVLISSNVVYFRTCTPRSWRRTIRAHLFLQSQTMAFGIEFLPFMVEMERLLVVFSYSESQGRVKQSLEKELGDPWLIVFWRNFPKMAFKNSNFCYSWIVYSWRRSLL